MNNNVEIRKYKIGDPSMVSYFQIKLYEKMYGFKIIFEYYLLAGMADFLRDPTGGEMWVAECENKIVGSVAIVKNIDKSIHLRWFAVDETCQGKGIGKRLMSTAMDFCKEKGYDEIVLWTADILKAARHIYSKYGFVLSEIKENNEWTNHPVTEEKWIYKKISK